MNTEWEDVYFLSHVNIKNIIGKELINNDNVAVMELVKNSYDAGAKKVTVEFKNLKEQDKNQHQIIIVDDGVGMSKEDILHKWLNLAYSIKRVLNAQNNRLQAGNKGIGRFSCDRLGKKLDIYTKKDGKAYHLKIDWEDFENVVDYNIQINDIPMKLREVSDRQITQETSCKMGKQGTVLKISYLRTKWIKLNEDSLFNEVLNYQKFVSLKSTLEKLINKSQVESDNFKILLKVDDIDDKEEESYNKKINGEIENKFFEKLDFDTTYINSAISEDGQYIITKLKDRDKVIFKTIERNIEFPELKGVKIILMYLNPYGKVYFEKQMGIRSVEFGSVYLFINGFRIPPYGDIDNDSFGMEVRKNQGHSRYISNREIIGRIEIEDRDNKYQIISSREGIVQNESFNQLIHKSTKSTKSQTKNNGFLYKTLKRLEKYVVEGLRWDSTPKEITEAKIEEMIKQKDWNCDKEIYLLDRTEKLKNISKKIFKIIGIDSRNIVDLDMNNDILSHLLEDDSLKTQKNITQFLKEFTKVPNYAVNEKMKQSIKKLIKNIGDERLLKKVEFVLDNKLSKIDNILNKEESYKQLDKKIEVLKEEQEKLQEELEETKSERDFFAIHHSTDKQRLLDLHHSIGTASRTIDNYLSNIKNRLKNKNPKREVNEEYLIDVINKISFSNHKILTISNLATRAGFKADSADTVDDLIQYTSDYIQKICIGEIQTLDHEKIDVKFQNNFKGKFVMRFKHIEISMVIDNFFSNARRAGATKIDINIKGYENKFTLIFQDNGKGIDKDIQDKIFNLGFTTTDGSGMGLAHIVKILKPLNGTLKLDKDNEKTTFIVEIKNELSV